MNYKGHHSLKPIAFASSHNFPQNFSTFVSSGKYGSASVKQVNTKVHAATESQGFTMRDLKSELEQRQGPDFTKPVVKARSKAYMQFFVSAAIAIPVTR